MAPKGQASKASAAQPAAANASAGQPAAQPAAKSDGAAQHATLPLRKLNKRSGQLGAWAVVVQTEELEEFLRVVEVQRANHLRRTPGLPFDAIFTELHMEEIQNEWMSQHDSWMNAETAQKYNDWRNGRGKGDNQRAHKLQRQAFSAYLFQIMGNKHVLLDCIQHAICSVAQPAEAMRQFIDRWTQEKPSKRIATVNEDPPPQSSHGRRTRPKWTTR